ncbi:DinB family protein [Brevibacterium antiquum]|uniref:DinB family protein n=1 Tax=Brevibacterium antiquum TaxID=234835 RepID=UPI0018E00E1F|nr:DinB family protein [Brevibacterium antiquum]
MADSEERDIRTAPIDEQLPALVDEYRGKLLACLDGMSEDEARRSLVPSRTTLLSLAKHAIFVETVWFGEVVTGRYRTEYGLPSDSGDSFILADEDTVESVTEAYWQAVERSHHAVEEMTLDTVLTGHRSGPMPLRWIYLHMLRELAQHCGHAEILREQVLAQRAQIPSTRM